MVYVEQETKTCTFCNHKFKIGERKILRFDNQEQCREAMALIKEIKERCGKCAFARKVYSDDVVGSYICTREGWNFEKCRQINFKVFKEWKL